MLNLVTQQTLKESQFESDGAEEPGSDDSHRLTTESDRSDYLDRPPRNGQNQILISALKKQKTIALDKSDVTSELE